MKDQFDELYLELLSLARRVKRQRGIYGIGTQSAVQEVFTRPAVVRFLTLTEDEELVAETLKQKVRDVLTEWARKAQRRRDAAHKEQLSERPRLTAERTAEGFGDPAELEAASQAAQGSADITDGDLAQVMLNYRELLKTGAEMTEEARGRWEVLVLSAAGMSGADIGDALGKSPGWVSGAKKKVEQDIALLGENDA